MMFSDMLLHSEGVARAAARRSFSLGAPTRGQPRERSASCYCLAMHYKECGAYSGWVNFKVTCNLFFSFFF